MTQEQIKEYTLRISQANASQLVVIEYELLFYYLEQAQKAVTDTAAWEENTKKAGRYLQELMHGLELSREDARWLLRCYQSIQKQLLQAEIRKDPELLQQVKERLQPIQQQFIRIAAQDTDAPLMEHTQKVYAGLTYGKGALNETAVDALPNRGYQV